MAIGNPAKRVRGSPAHTLWSHKYTQAQFCIIFFHPESPAHTDWSHVRTPPIFQSHPRTQTGVTSAHKHNFASFFPRRVTRDRVGWGGVGWGWWHSFALAHMLKKRCAMDCFGTCFTHVQTCNVTPVQSATEWTASVHTLHMSKKHCYEPDNLHTWSTQNTQL